MGDKKKLSVTKEILTTSLLHNNLKLGSSKTYCCWLGLTHSHPSVEINAKYALECLIVIYARLQLSLPHKDLATINS